MTGMDETTHLPSQLEQLDHDLVENVLAGAPWAYRSWEPRMRAVVLGRGNAAASEVNEQQCALDNIAILRRRGGGGTVLLGPGILVISLVKHVRHQFRIKEYFQQINECIIAALRSLDVQNLTQQGHSDICIGDRKILGSSMYRKKYVLFYTASLMISNNTTEIDRYLQYPSKEPDYRKGRSHSAFLTTLSREYPQLTVERVKVAVDNVFTRRIEEIE